MTKSVADSDADQLGLELGRDDDTESNVTNAEIGRDAETSSVAGALPIIIMSVVFRHIKSYDFDSFIGMRYSNGLIGFS